MRVEFSAERQTDLAYNIFYKVLPDHVRVLRILNAAQAVDASILRRNP